MNDSITPEQYARACEIVDQASALTDLARSGFLDEACSNDLVVRRYVDKMLSSASSTAADRFLAGTGPISFKPRFDGGKDLLLGERLGPYVVQERVASGGMGSVYRAVRIDDYRQTVAIKVIKPGMDSEIVLRRFDSERQVLADLRHPNIASLFDAGTTADGRPFFVMEFVDGKRITDFANERELDLGDRLRLFQSAAAAVHFANERNVLHRDLKPSNILVTFEGQVKLVDFGIAKVTRIHGPAESQDATGTIDQALTPDYASPEQWRNESLTPASDVYSLGVILFELLAGRRPLNLAGLSFNEIAQVVAESPRPMPSAVAALQAELPEKVALANDHGEEDIDRCRNAIRKFAGQLRGDLDMIVQMALRNEPERRYSSAEKLAKDIDRYLERLPVVARPDSWSYRAQKFVARHPLPVAGAILVAGSLVAGWFVSTAALAAVAVVGGFAGTAISLRRATLATQRSKRCVDNLRSLTITLLMGIEPRMQECQVSIELRRPLLDQASLSLDRLARVAEGNASLLEDVAWGFWQIATALGQPNAENCAAPREASIACKKSIELARRLIALNAESLQYQCLLIAAESLLIEIESTSGDTQNAFEAQLDLKKWIAHLFDKHPDVEWIEEAYLSSCRSMQRLLVLQGNAAEAKQQQAEIVELCRKRTERYPDRVFVWRALAVALQNMAMAHEGASEYEAATENITEARRLCEQLEGAGHPMTQLVTTLDAREIGIRRRQNPQAASITAAPLNTPVCETENNKSEFDHVVQANSQRELGFLHLQRGDADAAIDFFNASLDLLQERRGSQDKGVQAMFSMLYQGIAQAHEMKSDFAAAERASCLLVDYSRRLAAIDRSSSHAHLILFHAWTRYADMIRHQGARAEEELQYRDEALRIGHEWNNRRPEDPKWKCLAAEAKMQRAYTLSNLNRLAEATMAAREVFSECQSMLNFPADSFESHTFLSKIYYQANDIFGRAASVATVDRIERLFEARAYRLAGIAFLNNSIESGQLPEPVQSAHRNVIELWTSEVSRMQEELFTLTAGTPITQRSSALFR